MTFLNESSPSSERQRKIDKLYDAWTGHAHGIPSIEDIRQETATFLIDALNKKGIPPDSLDIINTSLINQTVQIELGLNGLEVHVVCSFSSTPTGFEIHIDLKKNTDRAIRNNQTDPSAALPHVIQSLFPITFALEPSFSALEKIKRLKTIDDERLVTRRHIEARLIKLLRNAPNNETILFTKDLQNDPDLSSYVGFISPNCARIEIRLHEKRRGSSIEFIHKDEKGRYLEDSFVKDLLPSPEA